MEKITPIEKLNEMIATGNFEGLTAAQLTDAGICPTCLICVSTYLLLPKKQ